MITESESVMKDNFVIFKLDSKSYDFLIIATSYDSPLNSIKEIGEKIQVKSANLLFDLTLINGISKNRYLKCEYDVSINQLPKCLIAEDIDDSIKKISQNYFAQNEEVVKKSVIPNSLKYLLKVDMA